MRVLITGGSGTLGRRLVTDPIFRNHELFAPSHRELDVIDRRAVSANVERFRPDLVVHCAAVISARSSDSAEHKARTSLVNVAGTHHVAEACAMIGARLIYISTDFVFDGSKPGGLYREDDVPAPLGYYALSKFAGEAPVLALPNALVVRLSFSEDGVWPYPAAFIDRFTSKLPASQAAHEVALAATSEIAGILHVGGMRTSFFEYAKAIVPSVRPMRVAEVESNDPMPIDTSLDSSRWRAAREKLAP